MEAEKELGSTKGGRRKRGRGTGKGGMGGRGEKIRNRLQNGLSKGWSPRMDKGPNHAQKTQENNTK